ncbi:MAG: hypothetical protein V3V99_12460 [candidate division Zixibacteria bacterium]
MASCEPIRNLRYMPSIVNILRALIKFAHGLGGGCPRLPKMGLFPQINVLGHINRRKPVFSCRAVDLPPVHRFAKELAEQ